MAVLFRNGCYACMRVSRGQFSDCLRMYKSVHGWNFNYQFLGRYIALKSASMKLCAELFTELLSGDARF